MQGVLTETGPCFVNNDSNSTTLNRWAWNNHVNMLYIDQPLSTGYSYDVLVNGTHDSLTSTTATERRRDVQGEVPVANSTHFVGTFSGSNADETANSTANGAFVMWNFLQTWLSTYAASTNILYLRRSDTRPDFQDTEPRIRTLAFGAKR